jgi:hypothetical protein
MLEGSTKDRPGLDDQKLMKENTLSFFVRISSNKQNNVDNASKDLKERTDSAQWTYSHQSQTSNSITRFLNFRTLQPRPPLSLLNHVLASTNRFLLQPLQVGT